MKLVLSTTSIVLLLFLSAKADLISVIATGAIIDSGNSLNAQIYHPETNVSYTFQFDTEEKGYYIYNGYTFTCNDNSFSYPDYSGTEHYYFADFKGNFTMPDYIQPNTLINYGYTINGEYKGTPFDCSFLVGGSNSHFVYLYNVVNIDKWQVGTSVYGDEYSYFADGSFGYTYSNLTITGISKVIIPKKPANTSVPESSGFSMMLCGIIVLSAFGALRRRES